MRIAPRASATIALFLSTHALAQSAAPPPTERAAPAPAPATTRETNGLLTAGKWTLAVSYGTAFVYSLGYLVLLYPIPGLICHASSPGTCGLDNAELWPMLPLAGPFFAASASKTSDPKHHSRVQGQPRPPNVFVWRRRPSDGWDGSTDCGTCAR
jgi:hypothetical protein